jgi:Family of unknown function (DUF6223)
VRSTFRLRTPNKKEVVATSDGGIGTGNGLAGAVVALVVGLVGAALGGLALARSRQRRLIS